MTKESLSSSCTPISSPSSSMSFEERNSSATACALDDLDLERATTDHGDDEPTRAKQEEDETTYDLPVHPETHKALQLKIVSSRRPHMRAFYAAMLSFFVGATLWFAVAPLQTAIETDLGISHEDLFSASIASIAGSFIMRILAGTFCDWYGSRRLETVLLLVAAVACGLTALVQTSTGLIMARFFTGMAGATLVISQCWMSYMFDRKIIGLATGLVLGIGNAGGGFALLFLGSVLLPQLEKVAGEQAWRYTLLVPTVMGLLTAVWVYGRSDDLPQGQYEQLQTDKQEAEKQQQERPASCAPASSGTLSKWERFKLAALNRSTWILFCQYGVSSGLNAAMNNAAPLYFSSEFGFSTAEASAAGSAVGWLSLACFVGGYTSDRALQRFGLAGRQWTQFIFLLIGGGMVVWFAHAKQAGTSIAAYVLFSLFLTLTTGSTFALIPYVNPEATGSVAGIAASGGSVGAIIFLFLLRGWDYYWSFLTIGIIILVTAFLTLFMKFPNEKRQPEVSRMRSSVLESCAF